MFVLVFVRYLFQMQTSQGSGLNAAHVLVAAATALAPSQTYLSQLSAMANLNVANVASVAAAGINVASA